MEITQFFDEINKLKLWPSKRKFKNLVLKFLSTKFEIDKIYSEKEINHILNEYHTFNDSALLRRELFEAKILDRTIDCKKYWKVDNFKIKFACIADTPLILQFIKELAEYEQLLHEVVATEDILVDSLFSLESNAKVIIGYINNVPVSFALFFLNFSTFLGRAGIYIEDLYVRSEARSKGIGKKMISYLANYAKEENYGRLEWRVLNWNQQAINFYEKLGAKAIDDWTVYRVSGDELDKFAIKDNK